MKAVVFFLCTLVVMGCSGCGRKKEEKHFPRTRVQAEYKVRERAWTALVAEYDRKVKTLEEKLSRVEAELEEIKNMLSQGTPSKLAEIEKRLSALEKRIAAGRPAGKTVKPAVKTLPPPPPPAKNLVEQKIVREKKTPPPVPKPVKKTARKFVHLPAGAMARGTVLSGVYAPLSTEMPMPVALSLDEAPLGPNGSMVPLRHCVVFAKASGMLQGTRAILQLVRLSCVLPDGKPLEVSVDGYVTDDDGIPGIKGKVEKVPKSVMISAGISSFLKAIAEALAEAQTTVSVSSEGTATRNITGSAVGYTFAKGVSGFLTPFASYYARVTATALPVVVVPAGRKVHIFFRKGVTLEGFSLSYLANSSYVFHSLD